MRLFEKNKMQNKKFLFAVVFLAFYVIGIVVGLLIAKGIPSFITTIIAAFAGVAAVICSGLFLNGVKV